MYRCRHINGFGICSCFEGIRSISVLVMLSLLSAGGCGLDGTEALCSLVFQLLVEVVSAARRWDVVSVPPSVAGCQTETCRHIRQYQLFFLPPKASSSPSMKACLAAATCRSPELQSFLPNFVLALYSVEGGLHVPRATLRSRTRPLRSI